MPKPRPSAAMKPQSTWVYYPEVEVYSWAGLIERTQQLHQADLVADDYAPVQIESPTMLAALKGQLAHLIAISDGDAVRFWAPRVAIEQIKQSPVVLAFRASISQREANASVRVLQALPPPMLGECALVWTAGAWRLAEQEVLDADGRMIRRQLAGAIAMMATPTTEWWTEDDARAACDTEELQASLQAHLADLAMQRRRRQASPARWESQWQQLRSLARDLAEHYWAATQGSTRLAVVDKDAPAIIVPADALTQQIMRSLLTSAEYQRDPALHLATWLHPLGEQQVTITISQNDGETWTHLMDVLDQLGDEAVDTFCAVLALALATNGGAALGHSFYVSPDDVLALCGRQESNRAYTAPQRVAVIEMMNLLARILVSATLPTKRRNRVYRLNGPILHLLAETIGEYTLDTGEIVWQRRKVELGSWAAIAPQLSQQTVSMLRKVLSYHPQRERFAKRLGRFLTLQFAGGTAIEVSMGQLIKQSGIPVNRNNANRTRQTIENALAGLIGDGILGRATLMIESTTAWETRQQRIQQCSQGWWADYEQQIWRLEPPHLPAGTLASGHV
jgi:hypothetical protein